MLALDLTTQSFRSATLQFKRSCNVLDYKTGEGRSLFQLRLSRLDIEQVLVDSRGLHTWSQCFPPCILQRKHYVTLKFSQ